MRLLSNLLPLEVKDVNIKNAPVRSVELIGPKNFRNIDTIDRVELLVQRFSCIL